MTLYLNIGALMNRVKLQLPAAYMKRVARPHLIARLEEASERPNCLSLIIAPSGFGKTTLAASWATKQPFDVAWLSLDVEDNDVIIFLNHLIEAIRSVETSVGNEAFQMIRSPQPPSYLVLLKSLLSDLAKCTHPLAMVLDDYHVISANRVREAIIFLMERLPSHLHLVILSRSDPPFALPQLRLQNRLVEIKTADLRFSSEESEQFFRDTMGLSLSAEDVAMLNQRIEGWPAGLQMAGLAMRGKQNVIDFIKEFSGSNHYIVDHLAGAVFDRQEKHTQIFLLKTCILSRVNAALAEAMLQSRSIRGYEDLHGDSAGQDCQKTLENLVRANMFVVPLDEEHTWFQYHPLFADLLRSRLHVVDHPAFKELHLNAHAWYKQNGSIQDAVNHALMAEEPLQAVILVEQHATELLAQGDLAALGRWIGLLVEDEIKSRPWLCISQAWVNIFAGRLSGLDALLEQAEKLATQTMKEAEQRQVSIHSAIIRSYLEVLIGNTPAAVRWNKFAARRLGQSEDWASSMHHWVTGTLARLQDNLEQSAISFAKVMHIGKVVGNRWTIISAATDQGQVKLAQGDIVEARRIFEEALELVNPQSDRNLGCVSRLLTALANVDYEQGRLETALSRVEAAIEGNRFWKNPNNLAHAYATCARIQLAVNDFSGASDTLKQADHEMRGLPVPGSVAALLDAGRVRMWLGTGDLASADDWVKNKSNPVLLGGRRRKSRHILTEDVEIIQATAIRVLLAQKRLDVVNRLIDQLLPAASASGRRRAAMEFMVLRSIAYESAGQTDSAVDWMDKALQLARQSDFIQIFVDEGLSIQHLLDLVAASDRESSSFARRLLAALAAPKPVIQVRSIPKQVHVQQPLVIGSLSKREKEVLNLIAAGLTNHQIGLRLVISTGTVKAHSANIYRKLAAGNRVQAVERARELKLLG
jgi:LuxR family transcriptional regulator, maltose regulon positive regulatory protein